VGKRARLVEALGSGAGLCRHSGGVCRECGGRERRRRFGNGTPNLADDLVTQPGPSAARDQSDAREDEPAAGGRRREEQPGRDRRPCALHGRRTLGGILPCRRNSMWHWQQQRLSALAARVLWPMAWVGIPSREGWPLSWQRPPLVPKSFSCVLVRDAVGRPPP